MFNQILLSGFIIKVKLMKKMFLFYALVYYIYLADVKIKLIH